MGLWEAEAEGVGLSEGVALSVGHAEEDADSVVQEDGVEEAVGQ